MSNAQIHPTAMVDPKANIGNNVTIGPFCQVGPHVSIGDETELMSSVILANRVTLGKKNKLFPYAVIGMEAQDAHFDNYEGEIHIGDENIFREYFNAHLPKLKDSITKIGSHGYFMANTHVAHDCIVGDHAIMVNYSGLAGHSELGDYSLVSGFVIVHQFARVGAYAIVGGVSKVSKDIPPYCMANGNPADISGLNSVGLKRSGMSIEERSAIKKAFQIYFLKNKGKSIGVTEVQKWMNSELEDFSLPHNRVKAFLDFIKLSDRGIASHASKARKSTASDLP